MGTILNIVVRGICLFLLTLVFIALIARLFVFPANKDGYYPCIINSVDCEEITAFKISPLSAKHFTKIASFETQPDKLKPFLEHAYTLSPRDLNIRLSLAQNAIRLADYKTAISLISDILRFKVADRTVYFDALLDLAIYPESFDAFKNETNSKPTPKWIKPFLAHIAKKETPARIYQIAGHLPEGRTFYVNDLIRNKDIERAFLAWQQFSSPKRLVDFRWPTDPNFKTVDLADPFGWKLHPKTTEQQQDGLYSFFSGKGRTRSALQILLLSPGNYTFTSRMSGHSKENGGHFIWKISCPTSKFEAGSIKIRDLHSTPKNYSFSLTIPEKECSYQHLELWGDAGEYPIIARTLVENVSLTVLNDISQEGE